MLSSFSNNGNDEGMKALQDELKSLRQLLEQQQQKPVGFYPSSFQVPFWQPGLFPFSTPVHSGTTHGNSVPPAQQGSVPPTHNNSVTPNRGDHVPPTHRGSSEHSEGESVTVVSDSSSSITSSHENHHTTSATTSEPSPVKPHTLTSKVTMGNTAQQQHAQPVSANDVSNKSVDKHRKMPSHKNTRQHKKVSSPSPEVQHSDQSDSTVSLLTSSDVSTLSVFDSARLSPTQLNNFQGDDPVATETMRVPSNANLSTWVCPLCGGRSVIINSSGTRQHSHRQPERVKTQSRSTQSDRISYRHSGQSPRRQPHRYEKSVSTEKDNLSKPRYTPNVKSSGLHYNSDVSSNRSSDLHNNRNTLGNRSSGLHHNGDVLSNRSSGLRHGNTPPVQGSGLNYSSDIPGLRSSGSQYKNRTPGIRSSILHYNSDTPVVRSTGTQYNSRNR